MRPIKYRAFSKKDKKMYSDLIGLHFDGEVCSATFLSIHGDEETVRAEDLEIMPFTGYRDTKKKEIYLGDYCKYFMDGVWKYGHIIWWRGGFAFYLKKSGDKVCDDVIGFQHFIPCPDNGDIMGDQFEVTNYYMEKKK